METVLFPKWFNMGKQEKKNIHSSHENIRVNKKADKQ